MADAGDLRRVLKAASIPWGYYSGGAGQRMVWVADLLRCAREEGLDTTETQLDELVREIGGYKELSMIDLQDIPRNLWRKMVSRPLKRSQPVYILPPAT